MKDIFKFWLVSVDSSLFPSVILFEFGSIFLFVLFSFGILSNGPCLVGTIGTLWFLGPTVNQSSVIPDLEIFPGVRIYPTGEDSGSFLFLLGVGVCIFGLLWALSLGVVNRLLFIWSVFSLFFCQKAILTLSMIGSDI